ncbi:hypothetical protein ScPMuIL_007176 [Solemya velum]
MSDMTHGLLNMKPITLGMEVCDINLNEPVSDEIVEEIKKAVHKHRILVFKNQGVISGDRHVEISRWFGEPESTFYKHPKSPHPDVFRVSNDEDEGCRGVGRTGWHIDGSFMEKPFSYALYHMVAVPKKGDTVFVPLNEVICSLSPETRAKWERLYMVSDRRMAIVHPLIYPHPVTGLPTLCFHLGMTEGFVYDHGSENQRLASIPEVRQILGEILKEIVKDNRRLVYAHKWDVGDFIISDNLSVGHEASEESQYKRSEVGLRVLHRVTVEGKWKPEKNMTRNVQV